MSIDNVDSNDRINRILNVKTLEIKIWFLEYSIKMPKGIKECVGVNLPQNKQDNLYGVEYPSSDDCDLSVNFFR